ncbi:hypothetical protein [Bergeyella zoohelcum]|uniref:hypothetical protein n=1 Tax=Bergeyella zoohelcum TaxID=1015 RepID=UPI003735820B
MDKKQFLAIVKKHFLKFGFSNKVLGEISALVDFTENETTEEEIIEQLKRYEPIAKSFQSELDTRLAKGRKTDTDSAANGEDEEDNTSASGTKTKDATNATLEKILERLDKIEKGAVVKTNNEKATTKLKELGFTDKEIESAMFERNFETEDSVEEFVKKQSEILEDILKERVRENAGNGLHPHSSGANYSKAAIEKDIEEFNKNN